MGIRRLTYASASSPTGQLGQPLAAGPLFPASTGKGFHPRLIYRRAACRLVSLLVNFCAICVIAPSSDLRRLIRDGHFVVSRLAKRRRCHSANSSSNHPTARPQSLNGTGRGNSPRFISSSIWVRRSPTNCGRSRLDAVKERRFHHC